MTGHDRGDAHVEELLPEFVAGRLTPDDHARVRRHLDRCSACRAEAAGLAPLTAALRELDPHDLLPEVPVGLDERVAATLDAEGRRDAPTPAREGSRWKPRLMLPAAAALVGAVAAGSIAMALNQESEAPPVAAGPVREPVTALAADGGLDVEAQLVDHTWGLEIDLQGTGFQEGARYRVVVLDGSGQLHPAGEFVGVGAVEMECELSSAILRADAVAFRVVGSGGRTVVRGDLAT